MDGSDPKCVNLPIQLIEILSHQAVLFGSEAQSGFVIEPCQQDLRGQRQVPHQWLSRVAGQGRGGPSPERETNTHTSVVICKKLVFKTGLGDY